MARTPLESATDLLVSDVIHKRFSALPGTATVGDVRAWFDESSHRRLAVIAHDGRYVGSLTREDLNRDLDAGAPAAEAAHEGPTIAPDARAAAAHELALTTDARRVPVVDADGRLLGVVGVTEDRAAFCGTGG